MGGLFSTPKAPPAPPAAAVDPEPSEDERKARARLESARRLRRGRPGLVKTGPRGLLALTATAPRRKILLGE